MLEDDMLSELREAFHPTYPKEAKTAKEWAEEVGVTTKQMAAHLTKLAEDGTWARRLVKVNMDGTLRERYVYWKLDTGG